MSHHPTRRAAREAAERQQTARAAALHAKPRRAARTIWIVVALIVIVLLAAAVWLAFRALGVKNDLEGSKAAISQIQNGTPVEEALPGIAEKAESAASVENDPVWRAAEFVPAVGDNLRGVRLAAQTLDGLVNDVALPVFAAKDAGQPVIGAVVDALQASGDKVADSADELVALQDSPFLVGPVRDGVDQVADVAGAAGPALRILPEMLGADGPRNYLLVFQNNAETLALGGSAAAQTLVNVNDGAISMANQGNSRTYQNGVAVDVPVDPNAIALYTTHLVDHINTSMSRPDFPTAAQLMRAWWQRDISPDDIHGVISVDPIALSRILRATGPIDLPLTGDTLTEQNAVSLLLNEVYFRWDSYAEPEIVDGFFASAAAAVFDRVASGSFNIKDMLWAVGESASKGDILMWSDKPEVQEIIADQPISGVLPTDNAEATTMGVFFNNSNGSKIDYYTRAGIQASSLCSAEGKDFTVNASIALPMSQDEADALPRYVQSMEFGSETFRDWIFVYGPPGTAVLSADVAGEGVSVMHTDIDDLGRPVVAFEAWFRPGETANVTATFRGVEGDFGPLEIRTNPMINATPVTVDDTCATG